MGGVASLQISLNLFWTSKSSILLPQTNYKHYLMHKCILASVGRACLILFLYGQVAQAAPARGGKYPDKRIDLQADLVVESTDLPVSATVGLPFPLSAFVANRGDDWANASSLQYFLSTDTEWSPDDLPLGADAVGVLPPSARELKTRSLTPPEWLQSGPHFLLFRCDAGNTVEESDENNVFSYPLELLGNVLPQADLVIGNLSAPASVRIGDPFNVQADVRNTGDAPSAFCNWTVRLSSDATLSADDQTLAALFIPPLSPGQSAPVQATVQLGMDYTFSGGHTLFVIADSANKIPETNENNNISARNLALQGFPPPADCRLEFGAGELLCAQPTANNGTLVHKKVQKNIQTLLLDADGQLVGAPSTRPLAFDSVLVQNKRVLRRLANGTVVFQKDIPANVFSKFPNIEAAAILSDGSFMLAGFQKYYDPQGNTFQNRDSLVLIRTDADLNFRAAVKVVGNSGMIDLDRVHTLYATADGGTSIVYTAVVDRLVPTPFLTIVKYNAVLQALQSVLLDGRTLQSLTQTPCNNWLLKASYQTVSAKGYDSGHQTAWLDLENARLQQRFVAGFGSLSQFGAYRDYYVETPGPDSLFAGFSLLREGANFDSVGFTYHKSGTGQLQRRKIPFMAFQQLTLSANDRYLLLGSENGKLWGYAGDCKTNTNKADLELSLRAEPANPALWQYAVLTLILKNNGAVAARDIRVDFMNQSDPAIWSRLAYVNANAPQGTTYNSWYGYWDIPVLQPGESRTLQYTLFTKVAEIIPVFAQVAQTPTPDADSAPGNNPNHAQATEDDEAFLLIRVVPNGNQHRQRTTPGETTLYNEHLEMAAHPNPATTSVLLRIDGGAGESAQLRLVDVLGRAVFTQQLLLEGITNCELNLQNYPAGPYALHLLGENGKKVVKPLLIGGK